MNAPNTPFLDFIRMYDAFYVLGHKEPDGDCAGSQLALASFLNRLGKEAWPLSAGPFSKPEVMGFEDRFLDAVPDQPPYGRAAALVVDCSSLSRTGALADLLPDVPVAFIDHHTGVDLRGGTGWIEPGAASVTSMVLVLIERFGMTPTREEAELLFYGLATDTGFFRHPDETGAEAFVTAARLVEAGASPKRSHFRMYGNKTLASRYLLADILARIVPYHDGRLLVSWIDLEDQRRYGPGSRDPDLVFQLLMTVADCEVSMVVRQETERNCTVGLRSRGRVNVAAFAAGFGGGGHRLAAGLSVDGLIPVVRDRLVAALAGEFT